MQAYAKEGSESAKTREHRKAATKNANKQTKSTKSKTKQKRKPKPKHKTKNPAQKAKATHSKQRYTNKSQASEAYAWHVVCKFAKCRRGTLAVSSLATKMVFL